MGKDSIAIRIPSTAAIAARLARDGLASAGTLAETLRRYLELLARWNRKIRLTAIREPEEILERHLGEAFFAVRAVPISPGKLVDIGSGAGFPAIPIKLVVPQMDVTLVESNRRKCAFLKEVILQLGLKGISVRNTRFEELRPDEISADYITCRAVGQFETLIEWAKNTLIAGGRLVLWLGRDDARRISLKRGWTWEKAIELPNSKQRVLLVGRPTKNGDS